MKKTLTKLAMVFSLIFCISSTLHITTDENFIVPRSNKSEDFTDAN